MSNEPAQEWSDDADRPPGPRRRERVPQAAPPRPALAESAPAPILVAVPPPGPVKAARSLWLTSFAAGLVVALIAFPNRGEQVDRLRQAAAGVGTGRDPSTLDTVASVAWWSGLGALLLLIVLEAALLSVLLRRRGWPRWVLLALLPVHLGVMMVAASVLAPPGAETYLVLLLAAQAALAAAAVAAGLLPRANAWLRTDTGRTGVPGS
jgi:hypothetical protein